MVLAGPVAAQASFEITERWVSGGGNAGSSTGTGGITVDEGEEVEFTIKSKVPENAQGALWVRISCGGATNCYEFLDFWPRIGSGPSNPNTKRVINFVGMSSDNFLVITKDDNCKKKGSKRYVEVWFQVNEDRQGGDFTHGTIRITIEDDDRDGTDPLGHITFLKPECGATSGG